MASVWVVERYVGGQGTRGFIAVDGVWSSEAAAVAHLERDLGARCEDPGYEVADDTSWSREGPGGCEYVWYVDRYEVDDG